MIDLLLKCERESYRRDRRLLADLKRDDTQEALRVVVTFLCEDPRDSEVASSNLRGLTWSQRTALRSLVLGRTDTC